MMEPWVLLFFQFLWLGGALYFLYRLGQICDSFLRTLVECSRSLKEPIDEFNLELKRLTNSRTQGF